MTNVANTGFDKAGSLEQARRAAIDTITTMRARTIRLQLFAELVLSDASERNAHLKEVDAQIAAISRALHTLRGRDPDGIILQEILEWLEQIAASNGQIIPTLSRVLELSERVRALLVQPEPDIQSIRATLQQHRDFCLGPMFPIVTDYCDELWNDLDKQRANAVDRANQAGASVHNTLSRLENIGKHVRIVAINASIEANRIGDAGKGISLIASEFKALAEEIQRLSLAGAEDIDRLT